MEREGSLPIAFYILYMLFKMLVRKLQKKSFEKKKGKQDILEIVTTELSITIVPRQTSICPFRGLLTRIIVLARTLANQMSTLQD
jgi:hypothetical protein